MSKPLVTFLVTCFNYGRFLPECIDSILGQSHRHIELIVLDDASEDSTPSVMRTFRDDRLTYVRQDRNIGLPRNFNSGLALSRGDFVWGISADDRLANPNVLEKSLAEFDRDPTIGYVWTATHNLERPGHKVEIFCHGTQPFTSTAPKMAEDLVPSNRVCAATVLVRAKLYRESGGYPLELPFLSDWYCWFRFGLAGSARYLPEPSALYRMHESNMTHLMLGKKQAQRIVEQLRLHLTMPMLATSWPTIANSSQAALLADLSALIHCWLHHPAARSELMSALAAPLVVSGCPPPRKGARSHLGAQLRHLTAKSARDALLRCQPRRFLRSMLCWPGLVRLSQVLAVERPGG